MALITFSLSLLFAMLGTGLFAAAHERSMRHKPQQKVGLRVLALAAWVASLIAISWHMPGYLAVFTWLGVLSFGAMLAVFIQSFTASAQ